jgi:hypothetical protein
MDIEAVGNLSELKSWEKPESFSGALTEGDVVILRQAILAVKILMDEVKVLKAQDVIKTKRLQKLETWRKWQLRSSTKPSRDTSIASARSGKSGFSDGHSKASRKGSRKKSVQFADGKSDTGSVKSVPSGKSKKNKNKNKNKVKLFKNLAPEARKDLRKMEKEAYAKVKAEDWKKMTEEQKVIAGKERRLRILGLQQYLTSVSITVQHEHEKVSGKHPEEVKQNEIPQAQIQVSKEAEKKDKPTQPKHQVSLNVRLPPRAMGGGSGNNPSGSGSTRYTTMLSSDKTKQGTN